MRNFYSILACLFLFLPIDLSAQKFEYSYDFPGSDAGNDVAELSDGSIITVGLSNSYGAGGNDMMVMKTSSSGTLLWIKYFGGTGDDGGNAVRWIWMALNNSRFSLIHAASRSAMRGLSDRGSL